MTYIQMLRQESEGGMVLRYSVDRMKIDIEVEYSLETGDRIGYTLNTHAEKITRVWRDDGRPVGYDIVYRLGDSIGEALMNEAVTYSIYWQGSGINAATARLKSAMLPDGSDPERWQWEDYGHPEDFGPHKIEGAFTPRWNTYVESCHKAMSRPLDRLPALVWFVVGYYEALLDVGYHRVDPIPMNDYVEAEQQRREMKAEQDAERKNEQALNGPWADIPEDPRDRGWRDPQD